MKDSFHALRRSLLKCSETSTRTSPLGSSSTIGARTNGILSFANQGHRLFVSRLQQCCKDWQLSQRVIFCQVETKMLKLGQGHLAPPPTSMLRSSTALENTVINSQIMRVIPVICNMSTKSAKHPRRAASHAPSSIALGMIIPLCSRYQPKTDRAVELDCGGALQSKDHMYEIINAPGFELTPRPKDSYEIYIYSAGRKMGYEICPETDCEEVSPIGESDISIVEVQEAE